MQNPDHLERFCLFAFFSLNNITKKLHSDVKTPPEKHTHKQSPPRSLWHRDNKFAMFFTFESSHESTYVVDMFCLSRSDPKNCFCYNGQCVAKAWECHKVNKDFKTWLRFKNCYAKLLHLFVCSKSIAEDSYIVKGTLPSYIQWVLLPTCVQIESKGSGGHCSPVRYPN